MKLSIIIIALVQKSLSCLSMVVSMRLLVTASHFRKFGSQCTGIFEVVSQICLVERSLMLIVSYIIKKPFSSRNYIEKLEIVPRLYLGITIFALSKRRKGSLRVIMSADVHFSAQKQVKTKKKRSSISQMFIFLPKNK